MIKFKTILGIFYYRVLALINSPEFILSSPDNSIFETLSGFVRATQIDLIGNNITEIPSNAFNNTELEEPGWFLFTAIEKIGEQCIFTFEKFETT